MHRVKRLYYQLRTVLTTVTFLGVVFHEFAHKKFCLKYRIPVKEVCYFQFGHPAGYVKHARPKYYRHMFMIGIAPFILNTMLAYGAFFTIAFTYQVVGLPSLTWPPTIHLVLYLFLTWFGAALAMHAFPSDQDAHEVWRHTKDHWKRNPLVLLGVPVLALIKVVNRLQYIGADIIYAVALFAAAIYASAALPL